MLHVRRQSERYGIIRLVTGSLCIEGGKQLRHEYQTRFQAKVEAIRVSVAKASNVRQEHGRGSLQRKVFSHEPQRRGIRHRANHVIGEDVFRHIFRCYLLDQFHASDLIFDSVSVTFGIVTWHIDLSPLRNELQHGLVSEHVHSTAMLIENVLQADVTVVAGH